MWKLIAAAISTLLVFAFPQEVSAAIHHATLDERGGEQWVVLETDCPQDYSPSERAAYIFSRMFEEGLGFVPHETALLGVSLNDGHLVLDVSAGISSYGGGSLYERLLSAQIIKTALDITGVEAVTLLIEGKLTYLPEGTVIYKADTPDESLYATHRGDTDYEDKLD